MDRMEHFGFGGIRPPRVALGLLAAAFGLHWTLPAAEAFRLASAPAAVIVGAAGFALMMWAWGAFKRRRVPVCPGVQSGVLISHGPFRVSRNPMYLGMTLMLLAVALWLGTPPFYGAALVFPGIIHWVFIPIEERKLEKEFGAEYIRYRNRVRRWI